MPSASFEGDGIRLGFYAAREQQGDSGNAKITSPARAGHLARLVLGAYNQVGEPPEVGSMSRVTISVLVYLGLIALAMPVSLAQDQEGNAPPQIIDATWEIGRLTAIVDGMLVYGPFLPFDPATELASERDLIRVTVTIVDPDWTVEDNDDEVFVRQVGAWIPFADFLAPEPPPIPGDDDAFQPKEGPGLSPPEGQTQIDYTFEFQVPEFEGKNQARLRGLIDYDVRWLMQFVVSNSQDPGIRLSEFGIVTGSDEPIFVWAEYLNAIENPIFSPANPPAFADAGADQVVEVGSAAVLDAGRTYDGFNLGFDPSSRNVFEKDALAFTWEWISGPQRVEPAQNDPGDPQATVTLNLIGEYVFRVTVDDNVNSLPSTDSVAITVVQDIPGNQAPIAVVDGPAGPVTVGDVITLDGSGSRDPDGDPLEYHWRQTDEVGGPLPLEGLNQVFQPISGREQAVSTWQAVHPGTFQVRLLISDGLLTDVSDIHSIDVVEPATAGAPAVSEAEPAEAEEAGEPVELPAPPVLCGAGMFPLALVPLLMWPMRGRIR